MTPVVRGPSSDVPGAAGSGLLGRPYCQGEPPPLLAYLQAQEPQEAHAPGGGEGACEVVKPDDTANPPCLPLALGARRPEGGAVAAPAFPTLYVLTRALRTRTHPYPQYWLLCHMRGCEFEFKFSELGRFFYLQLD